MYYGSVGETETQRDYLAELKQVLPCWNWEAYRCRNAEDWGDEGVEGDVSVFPHCDLMKAAEAQQPEAIQELDRVTTFLLEKKSLEEE